MATGRKGSGDIPDLDLSAPAPRPKAPQPAAKPKPKPAPEPKPAPKQQSPQDYFGSGTFDADHFGEGDVDLALDHSGEVAGGVQNSVADDYFGGQSFGGDDDFDGGFEDMEIEGSTAMVAAREAPKVVVDGRKWPTGRTPESESLDVDSVEVGITADYGKPPGSPVMTPMYSYRVFVRKRALQEDVTRFAKRLADVEKERDEKLAKLVKDRSDELEKLDETKRLLEPMRELEELADKRRSALAGTNAEYDQKVQILKERMAQIDEDSVDKEATLEQRRAETQKWLGAYKREEVKYKRLFIELRSIVEVSERQGGSMSGEQAKKSQQLEAQIAQLKPKLAKLGGQLKKVQALEGQAQAAMAEINKRRRDVDRQQQALDQQFKKQIGARSEGVTEAETQALEVAVDVARQVLAMRGRVDVDDDTLEALLRMDERVAERALELEKYARALSSYDHDAFKKGIAIGGGGIVVVLLLLIVAALL